MSEEEYQIVMQWGQLPDNLKYTRAFNFKTNPEKIFRAIEVVLALFKDSLFDGRLLGYQPQNLKGEMD